jgi:hypothetical protein
VNKFYLGLLGGLLGGLLWSVGSGYFGPKFVAKTKPVEAKKIEAKPVISKSEPIEAPVFIEAKPLPLRPKFDPVAALDGKGREVSVSLSKMAQETADYTLKTYQGKQVLIHTNNATLMAHDTGTRENVAWGGPGYDWESIYPVWHGSPDHRYNWQVGGHYMGYGKATAKNGVTYFVVIYSEKP